MLFSTTTRRRLGIVATACLISVALPAGAALAQKTKTKPAPTAEASSPSGSTSTSIDIPVIEAVDSNVDDETLRAIFSGAVAENADALAGLTATSILIPEIIVSTTATVDGETSTATISFADIELADVDNGIAASIALSGATVDAGDDGTAELGLLSAANFNIGGVLGLWGLVDGSGHQELETIYTDFSFSGGTLDVPEASCTLGGMTAAELKARPLNYAFPEIMALAESLEAEDETPSPEAVGELMRMYVDLFTAFESSPADFEGLDCSGVDDEGNSVDFSIAGMSTGGMRPGIYPSLTMDGLDVTVENDGTVQVGNITIEEIDFSGPIAAINAAPEAIDEAWLTANARALMPAFGGFSLSDILVDVPDPDVEGERIAASVGTFDLALGAYLNGVPTQLRTSASNVVVDLPEDTEDEQLRQLIDLGITSIDAGFVIDLAWNEAEDAIAVNEISMTGADLASVALTGTITNATEALFSINDNEALAAAMVLAISNLKLDVTDAGLTDIILATVAAEQGSDPATMRTVFAGLAQGTVVGLLAGAAEAQKVGTAINDFVSGSASQLTIEMTAKDAAGIGLMDFMAAEDDPASLVGKVNINATAM